MRREGFVPRAVAEAALRALASSSVPAGFRRVQPLGGGCIHHAARVESADGIEGFLKWSAEPGFSGFGAEARGLVALAERGGVRVPKVLAFGSGEDGLPGWLLLELIRPGPPGTADPDLLGSGLATLHRPLEDSLPGWSEDGWIGTLPQHNTLASDWPTFWRDARLVPLLSEVATSLDREDREAADKVLREIDDALLGWDADGLSLLHGDLWSGNVLWDESGVPVLLDPSVYRGHHEVDLAMMELFGGFSPRTFETYLERSPLASGYPDRRRHAYQLYPLLVHLALFGEGYRTRVRNCLRRLAAAIS